MEHDLGPGKTTSNPFALQKQTSLLHRVVEGGAQHSTLRMNIRAHGDVGCPVNSLYYNKQICGEHIWSLGQEWFLNDHTLSNVTANHHCQQRHLVKLPPVRYIQEQLHQSRPLANTSSKPAEGRHKSVKLCTDPCQGLERRFLHSVHRSRARTSSKGTLAEPSISHHSRNL